MVYIVKERRYNNYFRCKTFEPITRLRTYRLTGALEVFGRKAHSYKSYVFDGVQRYAEG